jgi:predicted RNA-binding Zn ribbon-like protein
MHIMKNLNKLNTGSKPAPGELVIIQGFVNTLDIEAGTDEIATVELLKAWLVRHGLMKSGGEVSKAGLESALSLREGLRLLLTVNNKQAILPADRKRLNQLLTRYSLVLSCDQNGIPSLFPVGQGIEAALASILSQVVTAVKNGKWHRLKVCVHDDCRWAFYDASKNRSGRWCSMSVCGSREKARAYRRRHTSQKTDH